MRAAPRFAFATFAASEHAAQCQLLLQAPSLDLGNASARLKAVAVEVFNWEDESWAILVSKADSREAPTKLQCVFGVSNNPSWCDSAGSQGFPVIDAEIRLEQRVLTASTAVYGPRAAGAPATPALSDLIRIGGLEWAWAAADSSLPEDAFNPLYEQLQTAPEVARPDSELVGRQVERDPRRRSVHRVQNPGARIEFNDQALYPDLFRLLEDSVPYRLWRGEVTNPSLMAISSRDRGSEADPKPRRFERSSVFGPPAFQFEDVEIVGFRTDVRARGGVGTEERLTELIRDLNFHLPEEGRPEQREDLMGANPRESPHDFKYRVATGAVIIELLRYGKMKSSNPAPPFRPDDFMSQHELLARILVGRADDDTALPK
jgi:hypothetical protein